MKKQTIFFITVTIFFIILFSGCRYNGGKGEGYIEFDGKKYPLNECRVTITDYKYHPLLLEYHIEFWNGDYGSPGYSHINLQAEDASSKSEFLPGIYRAAGDFKSSDIYLGFEGQVEVDESNGDYDITYIGVLIDPDEEVDTNGKTKYGDVKLTYKGKIKVVIEKR